MRKSDTRKLWANYANNKTEDQCSYQSEHQMQKDFCKFLDLINITYFAIPNAQSLSHLDRKAAIRAMIKLKNEGLKPGVPDIFICEPTKNYSGLFIEMKKKPNKPSQLQNQWLEKLNMKNYKTEICYSTNQAITAIKNYMNLT